MSENGSTKRFQVGKLITTQIDHAISLQALQAMKPDGKAVLILGGKLGDDEERRSDRYHTRESRAFFYTLYQTYNVTDHFSIWGSLYRKQGAGFPIDLIIIEGQGKSQRSLPAADVPRIYKSFDQLKEHLHATLLEQSQSLDSITGSTVISGSSSSASAIDLDGDLDLGRLSGTSRPSGELDDSAGTRPDSSLPNHSSLPQRSAHGSSDLESPRPERGADRLGNGDHSGKSRTTNQDVDALNLELPASDDRVPRSFRSHLPNIARSVAPSNASITEILFNKDSTMANSDIQRQVTYTPHSTGDPAGTLVPVNMKTPTAIALARLETEVGNIDQYVAQKLEYGTSEQLHRYLTAEQVDAVALAIRNIEKNSGFIIGDQTGVGKGRVVASLICYAKLSGYTPIFITKKPDLYADMMRDLADIDSGSFNPFVTNENVRIPLANGGQLRTSSTTHKQEMRSLLQSENLGSYDGIFTTYYQLQAVGDKEPERREFLRKFANNSILLLDESHMAGGSINDWKQTNVANRAEFARELIERSQGVLYSSATYAKNPQVMTLYSKTNMRLAVGHMDTLVSLIQKMGVPGQQALATMLTEEGQYIRRERSYEGIRFTADVASVDRNVAENAATIMSRIMEFDREKQIAVKLMNKELKREAKALKLDTSIGEAVAKSIEFASLMHNLIDQMLLSLKAEATVERSLELLRNGEKPVITVANTMGSFIGNYASAQGIEPGEALNLDFGAMLTRYLERSREVILKDAYGTRQYNHTRMDGSPCYRLSDEELRSEAVAAYEEALDLIDATDFSNLPISPIDYIENRLQQAGYQTGEVTGREHQVEYTADGGRFYQTRTPAERSTRAAIETVAGFNRGNLDVMVLNQSGSTGISLHASERFADQRPRHMIVAQAERNIDDFMQMLGRIHRHGQVALPSYTLLCADIPAEKRPGAVLAKKMASLNASTTAARSSNISLQNVPDFINEYGDAVVSEIMLNNPELHARLGTPLKFLDEGDEPEAAIRKVTGRIPLLPLSEQEELYDLIEREYVEYVERQEAMGESILEAQSFDFGARTIARMEVLPADSGEPSRFTSAVHLDVVDVKTPRKPFTTLEAVNYVRRHLELPEITDENFDLYGARSQITETANQHQAEQVQQLRSEVEAYRAKYQVRVPPKAEESETDTQLRTGRAIDKFNARLDQQLAHVRKTLETFPLGTPTRIVTDNGGVFYGITARLWRTDPKGNPTAPGNWKIQFLLADPAKELTMPLSKVNAGASNGITATPKEYDFFDQPIYEVFDQRQQRNREERQIFTGNILRAMEKFNGKMINYTNAAGKTCQGVLTPPEFDIEKAVEQTPIAISNPDDVRRFLFEVTNRTGQLKTPDEVLVVRAQRKRDGNGIILQTPKAREEGGQYYLNEALMSAAGGGEFFSVGKKMMLVVPPERISSVIYYLNAQELTLAAFEQRHKAREMMGIELPQLELVGQDQFEAQADYVPFVPEVDAQIRASLEQSFNTVPEVDPPPTIGPAISGQASEETQEDSATERPQLALNSREFWAAQLSQLSDPLKQLLNPAQISTILVQSDPISAIRTLQAAQPLFADIYEELADFYLAVQQAQINSHSGEPSMSHPAVATHLDPASTIDTSIRPSDSENQRQDQPAPKLEQQLIDELQHLPSSWALTPIDAHKAPYRAGWQMEASLSQAELVHEIEAGAKGYGLRTGLVSGGIVAIDLDGESAHAKMLELSDGQELPETVAFTSGRAGRSQHLFQVPKELWSVMRSRKFATGVKGDDGKEEHVELRWQGLQSVLPPSSHPMTGQYGWIRAPQDTEIALVPQWVVERMLVEMKTRSAEYTKPNLHSVQYQDQWTDQDWALSYLAALHPWRADDRDTWLKVGMALHSVSSDFLSEWERWSAQSEKYKPGECEYIWQRFQENRGITIATLGGWAKEDGWHSPFEVHQESTRDRATENDRPKKTVKSEAKPDVIEEPYYPSLQDFKRWYFEARETGQSQKYLDRIQALAEDFKAKTPASINDLTARNPEVPLSSAAVLHVKQDSANYQAQIEQFVKDAKTILKYKGKQLQLEEQPVYEYQSRKHDYLLRYHCTTELITVEKAGRSLLQYDANHSTIQKGAGREDFTCFHQEATRLREKAKLPSTLSTSMKPNEHQR
ncbi:bifunctional DNA primase/polymerase [Cyanobacteria bacterium FACHB-63]|nr:bifunctional DNA primase/polymerase [Cyanobacteria bacterium FACHB-63]